MIHGQLFERFIWKQPFDFAPDRFIEPKIALSNAVVNQKRATKLQIEFQVVDFFLTERRKLLITRHVKKWIFKEAVIVSTNVHGLDSRLDTGAFDDFPHQTLAGIGSGIPVSTVVLKMHKGKLRCLTHGKTFTGKTFETTDYTDDTDKESEISVDNKPRRHEGTKIMKQVDYPH